VEQKLTFFANRPAVDIYGSDDLIYPSFGFILWPSYLARCTKVTFPAVPRTASIGDDGLAQPVVVSCVLEAKFHFCFITCFIKSHRWVQWSVWVQWSGGRVSDA